MSTKIGDMAVYISANTYSLARDLKHASGMVSSFAGNISKQMLAAARPLSSFARDMAAVGGGNLLAAGIQSSVGSMKDLVGESLKLAGAAEVSAAKFEALLGSSGEAKKLMGDLRSFAADSPLGLSDATAEAAKLLGAGFDRDQITPTLRAMSNLSMGDAESTKNMLLAYRQIKSLGTLQGDEFNQLAGAGTLSLKDLAKTLGVAEDQVLSLRERGMISFSDIQRTIKSVTEEGGRFAGLGEKYAGTYAGMVDKLTDSFDDVKREFGTVLIEELGLKDATQDMGTFLGRVKEWVNDLRPAIRMIGDFGKGLIQIIGESARAIPLMGGSILSVFQNRFPETLSSIKKGLGDLSNFKFDSVSIVKLGVSFARAIADAIESLRPAWRAFVDDFVIPLKEAVKWVIDNLDAAIDNAAYVTGKRETIQAARAARASDNALEKRAMDAAKQFGLSRISGYDLLSAQNAAQIAFDEVKQRNKTITQIVSAKGVGSDLELREARFRDMAIQSERNAHVKIAAILARKDGGASTGSIMSGIEAYAARMDARIQFDRQRADVLRNIDKTVAESARPLMKGLANAFMSGGGLFGSTSAAFAGLRKDNIRVDESFPARLSDLARKLNEKHFDPAIKFQQGLADLQTMRDAGRITSDIHDLGVQDLVKDLGEAAAPARIPAPVLELGSQELASMLANYNVGAGSGPMSVEGLLNSIKKIQEDQLAAARQLVQNAGVKPAVVTMTE